MLPLGWPPRLPWHCPQDRLKTDLPASLELVQLGIRIGQWNGARGHRVGEDLDARGGELGALEARHVVQEAHRRVDGDRRMIPQRSERLVLQRVDAAVELVAAAPVRPTGIYRSEPIRTGDVDVEDRGNRAPDVGDGLGGRLGRRGAGNGRPTVEQLHVGGQRDGHPNETVHGQVGVVVRGRAIDAEVVGVDRAEERVVLAGSGHLVEPRQGRRGSQLKPL